MGGKVHSCKFALFRRAQGVIRGHATGSSASFTVNFWLVPWVVGFIQVRSGSFGAFWCAPGVIALICESPGCRWVHSRSFGEFTLRPPGVRLNSGSFGCALGVVGFIRVRLVNSGAPSVFSGRRVHSRSFGSFGRT